MPEKLAVTNGGNSKQRLMLRNAAVQLQDCYGNAATGGGVQVGTLAARHCLNALSAWAPVGCCTKACASVPPTHYFVGWLAGCRCGADCASCLVPRQTAAPSCQTCMRPRVMWRKRLMSRGGPSWEICPSQRAQVGGLQGKKLCCNCISSCPPLPQQRGRRLTPNSCHGPPSFPAPVPACRPCHRRGLGV